MPAVSSEQRIAPGAGNGASAADPAVEPRVLAEQVRMLYARASIAQATVAINASVVGWIFWGRARPALLLGWVGVLWALAASRLALMRAYRTHTAAPSEARRWARRFTLSAGLTGAAWGASVPLFYAPHSPIHQVFLAFVLGGMTAGAAASNASYTPAFVTFAVPALVPMIVRLGAERDPIHGAMAFMLALFGVAFAGLSRGGSRTIEEAIRLRFRNEALVESLSAVERRLEGQNEDLERRVTERTEELERALALHVASEARLVEASRVLRESDRRKNEFIALLSHELRNPLAPIRNSLYVLEHVAPGSDKATLAREIISRQTNHLGRLVDDLLDSTRISIGKIELRRKPLDLCEVTRRACADHAQLLHDRNLALGVAVAGAVWIDADEARITQVIGNLLQNAAKFGRPGGAVDVNVGVVNGRAELRVRDDGVGIAPELLPRLFEPFVQADDGLARSHGGLGLGLALAKGLVELHGGDLRASSEGPGRGSEFVITLPLTTRADEAFVASWARPPARRSLQVLVIEDNVDAATSIATLLELEGHHVHIATDGTSGIARAHEVEPDVILCDIGLPDVDGYHVARTLRFEERISARLIAVSGYAQPEDCRRAVEAGFDAYLAKPPDLERLLALVSKGAREARAAPSPPSREP